MANTMTTFIPSLILGLGVLVILALLLRWGLQSLSLPAIVGFLAMGVALAWINNLWTLFGHETESVLEFLGAIGVIVLLFRVGIESDLHELLIQLPKAAMLWLPNMALSGIPGYLVTRYLLDYGVIPSLFVAIALTATSVGVSVAVWEETKKLNSKEGGLLLDTAELDDISGVALMALLFSVAPALKTIYGPGPATGNPDISIEIAKVAILFLLKLFIFVGLVLLCGKYLEQPLAHSARKLGSQPILLVLVLGLGLVIAGAAGLAGLSLPIGALFSGLLFSRHRQSYGIEPSYQLVYAIFVPFFFINIGYKIDPSIIGGALGLGAVLVIVAIIGKIIGIAVTGWRYTGLAGIMLIGVSMVPRAEITMVVIERGHQLGEWAVPDKLYAAMVLVSAVTCLGATVFLHWALRKWKLK
jgi:Kef-type K+ transport system membrane component KefB